MGHPPINSAEARERIKLLTGIERCPTQIRAFMKRQGLEYRKLVQIPSKANTQKQEQRIVNTFEPALEKAKNEETTILVFMDVAHFILSIFV